MNMVCLWTARFYLVKFLPTIHNMTVLVFYCYVANYHKLIILKHHTSLTSQPSRVLCSGSDTPHSHPEHQLQKNLLPIFLAEFPSVCRTEGLDSCWPSAGSHPQLLDISQKTPHLSETICSSQKLPVVTCLVGLLYMTAYFIKPEMKISRADPLPRWNLI